MHKTAMAEEESWLDVLESVLTEVERELLWVKHQASTVGQSGASEEEEAIFRTIDHVLRCAILLEDHIDGGTLFVDEVRAIESAFREQRELGIIHRRRSRGRPCLAIGVEQLSFFVQHGFKIADIADMFGCSRRTIERRMGQFGISIRESYSSISD